MKKDIKVAPITIPTQNKLPQDLQRISKFIAKYEKIEPSAAGALKRVAYPVQLNFIIQYEKSFGKLR